MTKFRAQKLDDLLTAEAKAGRAARIAQYASNPMFGNFAAVVHVEADDGSWCELDAESREHAIRLAHNWVEKMGARGASCRMLRGTTGALNPASFYTKFAEIDGDWD